MEEKIDRNINGTLRILWVGAALVLKILGAFTLQGLATFGLILMLDYHPFSVFLLIQLFSIGNIIYLFATSKNRCYTISWMLIIFILPIFGHVLYRLWGRSSERGWKNERLRPAIARGNTFLAKDKDTQKRFESTHPERCKMTNYLDNKGFPLYENTSCQYFTLGELQFESMLDDLAKAEKFIFLEYFILNTGKLWSRIEDVLILKAAEGVEVRLMIDDLGCITTISDNYLQYLNSKNIQVIRFNPIHRSISRFSLNYRNHRKITVIDGNIAYTGGTNIADEYANIYPKFGHWKDTAIKLEGDAVWSLTVTFLQMWESESQTTIDYNYYRPSLSQEATGFFQPFSDGPVNNPDNPAEIMYRKMINNASEYLYITTPYLVIDDSMIDTLTTAAQSGVDVRILTPKIWDKRYVHYVTESNYGALLKSGVKIYEYTPGYIHSKSIISDGDHAIIGSINMDYRSFHLNFENGVWICGAPVLKDMEQDFLNTFKNSEQISLEDWLQRPWHTKVIEAILGIFSVLL